MCDVTILSRTQAHLHSGENLPIFRRLSTDWLSWLGTESFRVGASQTVLTEQTCPPPELDAWIHIIITGTHTHTHWIHQANRRAAVCLAAATEQHRTEPPLLILLLLLLLTRLCFSIKAIVPLSLDISYYQSVSLMRRGPWLQVHWDPSLRYSRASARHCDGGGGGDWGENSEKRREENVSKLLLWVVSRYK